MYFFFGFLAESKAIYEMVMACLGAYVFVLPWLVTIGQSLKSLVNMMTQNVKLGRTSHARYRFTLLSTTALFSLFVEVNRSLF